MIGSSLRSSFTAFQTVCVCGRNQTFLRTLKRLLEGHPGQHQLVPSGLPKESEPPKPYAKTAGRTRKTSSRPTAPSFCFLAASLGAVPVRLSGDAFLFRS